MKLLITKSNTATRLLLTLCQGYGPEDEAEDDEDKLSSFFDEVLSGDLDNIPDEEEETEEVEKDETDPVVSEAEGGNDDDEAKPVVEPVVKDTPEPTETKPVVEQQPDPVVPVTPGSEAPVKTDAERQKEYDDTIRELEKVYAISDEDADAILTDPKTVLPQMQARAHVMLVQTMHNMMTALVPQLIQQVSQEQSTKKTLMDQFAAAWPDLVSKDVEPTVIQAVVSVRKQYPNASQDELIKKVGPVAYALLGKEAPVKQAPPAPAPKAKARPFTPARQQAAPPKEAPTDPMGAFFADIFEGKV